MSYLATFLYKQLRRIQFIFFGGNFEGKIIKITSRYSGERHLSKQTRRLRLQHYNTHTSTKTSKPGPVDFLKNRVRGIFGFLESLRPSLSIVWHVMAMVKAFN